MKAIKTACPRNCFSSCGIMAYVEDNKLIRVGGIPGHPYSKGLCVKGYTYPQLVNSPLRLKSPMIRTGKRGEGNFKEVTWPEAISYAADRLKIITDRYGPESLTTFKYSGSREYLADAVANRFLNLYGATVLEGSQCVGSMIAAEMATFGSLGIHPQYPEIWSENTDCVVIWGWDPEGHSIHTMPFINRAIARGAKLLVINTEKTRLASIADIHLQPRPGTDTALALGMMKYIIDNNLQDIDFILKYTFGYDKLLQNLDSWNLDKTSQITDVPVDLIVEAAKTYVKNKSILEVGSGVQRHSNGHQAIRAIGCLSAISGKIGKLGSHYNSSNTVASVAFREGIEKITYPEFSQIRVGRRQIAISLTNEAILAAQNPPIKSLICWRGNFISQHANVNKTLEAIKKLDLFIVFELFKTDDVDYADIVFPACSGFEQYGIHPSYRENHYIQAQIPVISPYYNSRSDIEIWSELGRAMGFAQYFPKETKEQDWLRMLLPDAIRLEDIMHPNGPLPVPSQFWQSIPNSDYKFATPSGKIELYSSLWEEQGSLKSGEYSPLPIHIEPEESPVSRPALYKKYPLILTSTRGPYRIHSQFHNLPWIQEIEGEPFVSIHPEDAQVRNIKTGDTVVVKNDRGSIELKAKKTLKMKRGVVNIWDGYWLKNGACPNLLTENYFGGPRDGGNGVFSDFNVALDGGSGSYYDCLVEVELLHSSLI